MSRICLFNSIVNSISSLIHSQTFLDSHRFPNHFVRKRILSLFHVVFYLLYSTKQNMFSNIDRMLKVDKALFPEVSKQAISKARQGIRPTLFQELYKTTVDLFFQSGICGALWKGLYHIYAIDGSKIELPSSASNMEKFGELFSKANPSRRWSQALISVLYDVTNDFIVHGLIRPFLSSERTAAMDHCISINSLGLFGSNSIIVFDRGYYSEDMFRFFSSLGLFCVMRLKENMNLSKSCSGDISTSLPASGGYPETAIRVIAVDLGNGTTEYLATNILDHTLSMLDFKELYFLRWGCELKYYELKTQLLLEEFNGATSISIEQEFYINLMYSNLASIIKKDADDKISQNANPENKHIYQANRAYIIGQLKDSFAPFVAFGSGKKAIERIFRNACKCKSQIQPGRQSTRKRVKNDRTHFKNRKTAV